MPVLEIIQEGLDNSPSNESATCEWIIVPVLHELGYGRFEVVPRATDANSQFPDYTILPSSDHTWYLEAKSVGVTLQDVHVTQALNYAHQNGKRWAVLSNGRDWRLYDDRVDGVSSDRLVVEASVTNPGDLETLLHALSRESVTSGGLERYASNSRLASELSSQLRNENSEVVRAMWNVLRKRAGLGGVTRKSVVEHFGQAPAPVSPPDSSGSSVTPVVTPDDLPDPQPSIARNSLAYLACHIDAVYDKNPRVHKNTRAHRPTGIRYPDGEVIEARKWAYVALEIVKWLVAAGHRFPMPFAREGSTKECFVNTVPRHRLRDMDAPREIVSGGQTLYVETNFNTYNLLPRLAALCSAAGVDPATIIITLAE